MLHAAVCCCVICADSDAEAERRAEKLLDIAARFSADELMVITITGDYATRLESYELLAKAFELAGGR